MQIFLFSFFLLVSIAFSAPATNSTSTNNLLPASKAVPAKSDEIDLPAPVGEEMKGITIPQYDADGKLKMKLSCETARKTDEHNVAIHGLKVEFFEKEGKDVTVTTDDAVFNLAKTLLSTETMATIQREDFLMLGDSATFDTTKRFGTMKGHVHTEVRNGAPTKATQAEEINVTTPPTPTSSSPWNFNFGHQRRPQDARTVIDAQDGAWFDDVSNTVEFFGKVVVRDPQFKLTCDRLNIVMNKNRQGLQLVTATGNVNIEEQGTDDSGEKVKSTGKAEVAVYEPATGDITLKALPQSLPEQWPQVRQGKNFQVATEASTVMVLNSKGTFHTKGQTRTMILDTGEKEKQTPEK